MDKFLNREEAARQLLLHLQSYLWQTDGIVLALPRGGVPLGRYLADALRWPLDVVVVKKIGHPDNPEFAVGSVSSTGYAVDQQQRLPPAYIQTEVKRLQREIQKKCQRYRHHLPPPNLRDKTVLLVDDGMATGSTMLGAICMVRSQGAKQIIVAVPVASKEAYRRIAQRVDRVYCLATPEPFEAVGSFYEDFRPVTDEEVVAHLRVD